MRRSLLLLCTLPFSVSLLGQPPVHSMFDFHSGFWVNLHQFLYGQARSDTGSSGDGPWPAAVNFYKNHVIQQNQLDREMETVNNTLSSLESATSLKGSGLDPALVAVLEAAAPVYREQWWPEHDRANRAWIASAQVLVDQYGAGLVRELAKIYGTTWEEQPIRTDVAAFATSGAYTTLYPTHITISSENPANSGPAALEILFHEASHALVRGVRDALSRQTQSQAIKLRRQDLWHALLFYTAGTLVERRLEGYSMYAIKNGLFDRPWPGALNILNQDWKPYIDGQVDMVSAVQRLVKDYTLPQ